MELKLGVGEYFGDSIRRRHTHDFVFTENRFISNQFIPTHAHELCHFTCVLAGNFQESYGQDTFDCVEGSVLFVPADQRHCDKVGIQGAHTLSVEISPRLARRIQEASDLLSKPSVLIHKPLAPVLEQLYQEFQTSDAASLLMLNSIALQILATIHRTTTQKEEPSWMPDAMRVINEDFSQGISLGKLAAELGISESYLAKTFRRIHGCSVGEYVRFLRLERAKQELANSVRPLSDVALDAGFYDQAHFSRQFKKSFGLTPTQFRKQTT